MAPNKQYDMVVFGATGYTGQYVVEYAARAAAEEGLRYSTLPQFI